MNKLTNDVYRTKKKLELLETEGIGQLLVDVLMKTTESNQIPVDERVSSLIKTLRTNYLQILTNYKPSKQTKIEFHNG